MPSPAQVRKRGPVERVRTVELPNGDYAHVYVMAKEGPRGGKTIMGEHHHHQDRAPVVVIRHRKKVKRAPKR